MDDRRVLSGALLGGFGIEGIVARHFAVNEGLSAVTRFDVGAAGQG